MPPDAVTYNADNDDMIYDAMMLATATLQFWATIGKHSYSARLSGSPSKRQNIRGAVPMLQFLTGGPCLFSIT